MPNTPVRAAAEGMPEISRRYFLTNTVAVGAAAATVALPVVAEAAAPAEHAVIRVNHLAKELSVAMGDWMEDMDRESRGGYSHWVAIVHPANLIENPVSFRNSADAHPDAELFRLVAKFEEADAEMKRLGDIFDQHERIYYDGKPKQPKWEDFDDQPKWTDETTLLEIKTFTSDKRLSAFDQARAKWERADRRFRKSCGYDAAEKPYRASVSTAGDIVHEILQTPAHTPQGMLMKIRLANEWGETDECLEHLVTDIRRMVGRLV